MRHLRSMIAITGSCLLVAGLGLGCAAPALDAGRTTRPADARVALPGPEWERGEPRDFGIPAAILLAFDSLMREARANGVLVRDGRLLAEWSYAGPPDTLIMVQSCTKSITSMMLGLAIGEGLIPGLDARVKEHWPGFEAGPYTDRITFRHLVTMTSGMAAVRWWGLEYVDPGYIEPGTAFHYHNDQPFALAQALTYLFGRELRQVLQERILAHLHADMRWDRSGMIEVAGGDSVAVDHGFGGSYWSARDLARLGLLYLQDGRWGGRQILPEGFVGESFTDIPFRINVWRAGDWLKSQPQTEESLAKVGYGLGWWTDRGAEPRVWAMGGHGGQFLLVLPDHGIVMTKLNDWRRQPFIARDRFMPYLADLGPSRPPL